MAVIDILGRVRLNALSVATGYTGHRLGSWAAGGCFEGTVLMQTTQMNIAIYFVNYINRNLSDVSCIAISGYAYL